MSNFFFLQYSIGRSSVVLGTSFADKTTDGTKITGERALTGRRSVERRGKPSDEVQHGTGYLGELTAAGAAGAAGRRAAGAAAGRAARSARARRAAAPRATPPRARAPWCATRSRRTARPPPTPRAAPPAPTHPPASPHMNISAEPRANYTS